MELKIKKVNEEVIIASFASEELKIGKNSEQWNTEGINGFLIKLASQTPNDQKIEIIYDENLKEDKVYIHIVDLFQEFAKEYNRKNE